MKINKKIAFILSAGVLSYAVNVQADYAACVAGAKAMEAQAGEKFEQTHDFKYLRLTAFFDKFSSSLGGGSTSCHNDQCSTTFPVGCELLNIDPKGILFYKPAVYQGMNLLEVFQRQVDNLNSGATQDAPRIHTYQCDFNMAVQNQYDKYTCKLLVD